MDEKQAAKITWAVVIVSVIAIVALGIFAASGLNYKIF
jgi:signal transduction histidine kinase